jgi:3-oxoisoapionate kinase
MPPFYCYYGDDFTGSTDVLEQLATNGVPSVLFLTDPKPAQMARFAHCLAIGFAGDARSRSPEWMSAHLPAIFTRMRALSPQIVHYKVCSTFDSAAHRGSIGRALEIGREAFGTTTVPIVVGAPHLGRFVIFGQLFAAAGEEVYRIDRHPTMAHHPATPMHEADLRLHLADQTALSIGLVDLRAFQTGTVSDVFRTQAEAGDGAVVLDGLDATMLRQTGHLLNDLRRPSRPLFTIGSSGLTSGLISFWREAGLLSPAPVFQAPATVQNEEKIAGPLLVLSGSCSEVTARQILWAKRHEYACVELDAAELARGGRQASEAALRDGMTHLRAGRDAVLYTSLGALAGATHGEELGAALGRLLLALVQQTGVRRIVLCGGDTSSHALQQLNLTALTFAGRLAPGAPLCRAHAEESSGLDGLELVLKGGQIGPEDFFKIARQAKAGESVAV